MAPLRSAAVVRPCSAEEAVARARSILGKGGQYALGTGNYRPRVVRGKLWDFPWTTREDGLTGSDCAGFIVWCYKVRRHRPGFNRGGRFAVSDDINTNSMIGDAMGARDLFELAEEPRAGDVLAWPSYFLYDRQGRKLRRKDGTVMRWIGHTGIVIGTSRVEQWDPKRPNWRQLDIAQCHGPDERKPAIVATDGSMWSRHDAVWPKPEHCTYLLRARP